MRIRIVNAVLSEHPFRTARRYQRRSDPEDIRMACVSVHEGEVDYGPKAMPQFGTFAEGDYLVWEAFVADPSGRKGHLYILEPAIFEAEFELAA